VIVVDVNVLLAAHLRRHPLHEPARGWLARALSDPNQAVVVPELVWVGFIRIGTNPRVFEVPSTMAEAVSFSRGVIAAPSYRAVPGLGGDLESLFKLCLDGPLSPRLVTDAYIAAVGLAYACPVATFDRDFRRFDGLELVTPS
jgi:toxin-antitoxin system PIN domain toxin